MRRFCAALSLCAAMAAMAGCGFTPLPGVVSQSSQSAVTVSIAAQGGATSVREGSTVQFTASLSDNSTGNFTWAVNGTTGGSASTGTIDASGKFTAPAAGVALANPTNVRITASAKGATSAPASLALQYPVPAVSSSDISVLAVGSGTVVTVSGTDFVNGAQILVNGSPVATTFLDSTHVKGSITAAAAGTVNVQVRNPDPGSATSHNTVALNAIATPVLNGVAAKNFLSGAVVTAHEVDPATGANGTQIGSTTTDANGGFSLHLNAVPTGPVRLTASGGSFVNDVDVSQTAQNTADLNSLLDSAATDVNGIAITILTDMTDSITMGLVNGTAATTALNPAAHSGFNGLSGNVIGSHAQGQTIVKGLYKLTKNPESTPPSNDGADADGLRVTIISGSMYQCALNTAAQSGAIASDWIKALSLDFSDGKFDGLYISNGQATPVKLKTANGSVNLSASAGTTDFLNCMNQFAQGTNTVLTQNNVPPSSITEQTGIIASAVVTSPVSPSTGLNSGGSGSVASMTINGRQYLFVAARNRGIVVIDITDPAAKNPPIKVWTNLANNVLGTTSNPNVGIVVPVLGSAAHSQLLMFSYSYGSIGILNAEKLVSGTPGVDDASAPAISAAGLVDFSGDVSGGSFGRTYGALLDIARKGVWIYVYGYGSGTGYKFFDLTTNAITTTFPQDAAYFETENLGGDTAANWIFGANYNGVQLIDVKNSISYDLDSTFYSSNSFEFDQSAVDTAYHVALGMSECYNYVGIFDLGKLALTAPASAGAPGGWAPATGGFVKKTLNAQCTETVGIESSTHLAIMSEEWDLESLYVAKIDNPAAPANGTWQGFSDWSYFAPNQSAIWATFYPSGTYSDPGAGDPHSIGTALAVANGKPYGYILSGDSSHLLVVDMQGMLGAQRAGSSGDAAHTANSDPAGSGLWWVLSW